VEGNNRLLRACATAAIDGMVIYTDSERVVSARKSLLELTLSTHSGDCKAPCQLACPAESDCQGHIALIAAGQLREAVKLMKDAHPFPASVARICPRPCESECRRKLVDEPINIASLKRFAADSDIMTAGLVDSMYVPEVAPDTGKSIAIIGGGPAGLTAAYFLRRLGHNVDVFDSLPKMGGLLRYGIPEYRLPKAIVDAETEVIRKIGVNFFNGVNPDIALPQLQSQYSAVIIAIGAGVSRPIGCTGDDKVIGGLDFLRAVASAKPPVIGKHVIVVGGSNTAMDAARTALRLGAEVTVAYRRTKDEMPAEPSEIEEAIAEGVNFMFLVAPLEVTEKDGAVSGMKLQKMTLGEPDKSGRRSPVPQPGSEEWIPADTIIAAIGQSVSATGIELPLNVDDTFRTAAPGVFAIGDATGKTAYAIEAIGHGRRAASTVHGYLTSGDEHSPAANKTNDPDYPLPKILSKDTKKSVDFTDIAIAPRQNGSLAPTIESFNEIHQLLTPTQAAHEADRCLSCGCSDYYECKLIKLANLYGSSTESFSGDCHSKPTHSVDNSNFYFHRDMNKCVQCGLCVRVCEDISQTISAVGRGFETTVSAAFGQPLQNTDECKLCGNCVSHCPVGALYEASPLKKPLVVRGDMTVTTCAFCGNGCGMKIATKAGYVLRCLPTDGHLCEMGKFGFRQLGEKLFVPLVRKEGLLRRVSMSEACRAIREGLSVLMAKYGAESIGVSVSPRYTLEDMSAIKDYAAYIGTPHLFTLVAVSDHKDFTGLTRIGVCTDSARYLEMLRGGTIKGLIHFGDDFPPEVSSLPVEFLALQTAYVSSTTKKAAAKADVILPAPAFGEVSGHIVSLGTNRNPSHTSEQVRSVNPAFPPACGYQTRELIPPLTDDVIQLKAD